MKQFNIALLVDLSEVFTEDFISMAILVACMCWPIAFIVWLGVQNYLETGHIFPTEPISDGVDEKNKEDLTQDKFPSPDPTLDNK